MLTKRYLFTKLFYLVRDFRFWADRVVIGKYNSRTRKAEGLLYRFQIWLISARNQ